MGRYKLTGFLAAMPERTAAVFEKYGLYYELKKNGSLWVSNGDYRKYYKVRDQISLLSRTLGVWENFPTFDHPRWYVSKDKSRYVLFYCPYPNQDVKKNWEMFAEHASEYGIKIEKLPDEDWFYSPSCWTYMVTLL